MVNGARSTDATGAFRHGHVLGNKLLTSLVAWTFGNQIEDMLSGFRVFSRRFVKTFPGHASGFEIETELTIHALELRMPVAEVMTPYGARPRNSESKLSTWRDGIRILMTIVELVKSERPLFFFSWIGLFLAAISIGVAIPKIILPWLETGMVIRIPTAILVTGLMLSAVLSVTVGLVLDTVTRGQRESKRLHYLSIGPGRSGGGR